MGTIHFYKFWKVCWISYRLTANVIQLKVMINVFLIIITKLDLPMIHSYLTNRHVTCSWTFSIFPYIDSSVWPSTQSWEHDCNDEANIWQWPPSTNKPAVERVWKLFSWFLVRVKTSWFLVRVKTSWSLERVKTSRFLVRVKTSWSFVRVETSWFLVRVKTNWSLERVKTSRFLVRVKTSWFLVRVKTSWSLVRVKTSWFVVRVNIIVIYLNTSVLGT